MEKLLLVDGHSILNRAFYGLPDLTNSEGIHTGAVYGFLNILFRIIEEEKPDYLTVAFDVHAPTFRHEMYAAYKGTRKPMPEELRSQVPLIKEVLGTMGICMAEKAGLEADDILGTLAYKGEAEGKEVTLLSGDRDLLQIATEKIKIRIPKTSKGKTEVFDYHAEDVLREWQLTPKAFIELKALMGDTADNIPGVPKVGQKTATELMVTYGSLDNIYAHLEEITKKSIHDSLAENKDLAYLSLKLATICTTCDLDLTFEDMRYRDPYTPDAYQMFRRLGFKNLLSRFDKSVTEAKTAPKTEVPDLFITIAGSKEEIREAFKPFQGKKDLGIRVLNEARTCLKALSIVADTTAVFACPVDEEGAAALTEELANLFREEDRNFVTFDSKDLYPHLPDMGADVVSRIFDTHIAAYLLKPLKDDHVPEDVILEYAGDTLPTYAEAFGKKSISEALSGDLTEPALYFCNQTAALARCKEALLSKLRETEQEKLFSDVEMPLSLVLAHMEAEGVMIAPEELSVYGRELGERILVLEKKIHETAGEDFNINSPKQLGEILFE
ncbi:MAG: DNA polymerase I, partial [Lachnospiraceae bacterium]|nr:DNA polymerase I [Lachnospiraceae bacterium]